MTDHVARLEPPGRDFQFARRVDPIRIPPMTRRMGNFGVCVPKYEIPLYIEFSGSPDSCRKIHCHAFIKKAGSEGSRRPGYGKRRAFAEFGKSWKRFKIIFLDLRVMRGIALFDPRLRERKKGLRCELDGRVRGTQTRKECVGQ